MTAAERQRAYRQRRGRGRQSDVAWVVLLPVTHGDITAMVRLQLLREDHLDRASVQDAVRKLWSRIEVEKIP